MRFLNYFVGETYQARAFRGATLSVGSLAMENVLRLGSNLILTRLLFPEAFGLMALVTVVLGAAAMFSDLGFKGAVFKDARGGERVFLDTIWTLQILRGFLLGAIIFVMAAPIARFYEAPLLANLLRVAALVPVAQGFNSTQLLSLNRELQLGRIVVLKVTGQIIGILVMIGLALSLRSVWALLLGMAFGGLVTMLLSHVLLGGPRNRFRWDGDVVRSVLGFGKFIFFASIAAFLIHQGDRAILGKFVSLDDLAFYNIAFFLATVPVLVARAISEKVIYPLYARRPPTESARNRRKIAKARRLVTGGLVAGALFAAAVGIGLVDLLYDDRYSAAGPLLVAIALFSLPILIVESYVKLPLAAGHSGRFAVFQIARASVQMGLIILLVPSWGLLGAVVVPGLTTLVVYPFLIWIIAPYRGWDPVHDGAFAAVALGLGALVLWLQWPSLATLFAGV